MSKNKLLAIDIGNTNSVLGVYEGGRLTGHWRMSSQPSRTADEIKVFLRGFLLADSMLVADIGAVAIASVVPSLTPMFESVCRCLFGVAPLVIGPGVRTGMPIRYDDPREVGADRIVNAVAAFALHKKELIVVDFGTATTFDCVSADGAYLGGIIAPGVGVSMDALFMRASKLPKVAMEKPPHVIGKNTVHAMQSGLYYGYAAMVDGLIDRLTAEMGGQPAVIATGGVAPLIFPESRRIATIDEHLTLEGLRLIHELNEAGREQIEKPRR